MGSLVLSIWVTQLHCIYNGQESERNALSCTVIVLLDNHNNKENTVGSHI